MGFDYYVENVLNTEKDREGKRLDELVTEISAFASEEKAAKGDIPPLILNLEKTLTHLQQLARKTVYVPYPKFKEDK